MKTCIVSPDATGWVDPPVMSLLRQIEGKVDNLAAADVALVPVSYFHSFRFAEEEMKRLIGRRWVAVCFAENGWDWNQQTSHLWGGDRITHPSFSSEEYAKFDRFYRENPPILTFQRELLAKDRTDRLLPIEYTAYLPESGCDTKKDFSERPLDAVFNWGRSSESRMLLHGMFFAQAPMFGYDVISEWSHIAKALKENISGPMKVASIHVPHFARIDVKDVQTHTRMAKIGVILNGCGVKTFRDGENCQDFLMARPKNALAWSYPWNESNSIVLPRILTVHDAADAVKLIMDALMDKDRLYELYGAACENAQNYRYDAYLRRHVMGNIAKFL